MRSFTLLLLLAAAVALAASLARAKDPAEGWLGYATATSPVGSGRITFAEAYWVVPENPIVGGAFYSPWFGIEAQPPPYALPVPSLTPAPRSLTHSPCRAATTSTSYRCQRTSRSPAPHFAVFPLSFCRCNPCSVPRVDVTARAAAACEPLDRL